MILLYIISILCSALLFTPDFIPAVVKWPAALLVVLLVVFFFNKKKGDSIYTTKACEKKVISYGLFNPLIIFSNVSFSLAHPVKLKIIRSVHINKLILFFTLPHLTKLFRVSLMDVLPSL